MKFLYARVSTTDQNLDRQLEEAHLYDRVYTEKISGKNKDRPELASMLKALREDDFVEVHSMDRLGRNLIQGAGATIHFKKENMTFTPSTDDPAQKLMMTLFGAFAEFERNLILSRQREGIAIAKMKGKYKKAHPKKLNNLIICNIQEDRKAHLTERELMNKYHISKPTLYRYLKTNFAS